MITSVIQNTDTENSNTDEAGTVLVTQNQPEAATQVLTIEDLASISEEPVPNTECHHCFCDRCVVDETMSAQIASIAFTIYYFFLNYNYEETVIFGIPVIATCYPRQGAAL